MLQAENSLGDVRIVEIQLKSGGCRRAQGGPQLASEESLLIALPERQNEFHLTDSMTSPTLAIRHSSIGGSHEKNEPERSVKDDPGSYTVLCAIRDSNPEPAD